MALLDTVGYAFVVGSMHGSRTITGQVMLGWNVGPRFEHALRGRFPRRLANLLANM